MDSKGCVHQWFKALAWEFNTTIQFYLILWLTVWTLYRGEISLESFTDGGDGSLEVLVLLVIILSVQPQSQVIHFDFEACRLKVVMNPCFKIFDGSVFAKLGPPVFEEVCMQLPILHVVRVEHLDANWLEFCINICVAHGALSGVESLYDLPAIPLEKELPQLLVYAHVVLVWMDILLYVPIYVFTFKTLQGSRPGPDCRLRRKRAGWFARPRRKDRVMVA